MNLFWDSQASESLPVKFRCVYGVVLECAASFFSLQYLLLFCLRVFVLCFVFICRVGWGFFCVCVFLFSLITYLILCSLIFFVLSSSDVNQLSFPFLFFREPKSMHMALVILPFPAVALNVSCSLQWDITAIQSKVLSFWMLAESKPTHAPQHPKNPGVTAAQRSLWEVAEGWSSFFLPLPFIWSPALLEL